MLNESDWLPQAKRLSIGMRVRVRHRNEGRANMVVGNDAGHWWAYCQRCKEGGRVAKEHVLLAAPPVDVHESEWLAVPSDLVPVIGDRDWEPVVGRFLASKGMMFPYLPKLWVSPAHKRMCLQDATGHWHGRDLTENSNTKWLHYKKPKWAGSIGRCTVITEDVLSMFKVQYAVRNALPEINVASTLGAGMSREAALSFKNCTTLVWAYDGDDAGDSGFTHGSKRMRVLVPQQRRARPPDGMDPKDMQCAEIVAMITEALK